jgi:hypothetical protein
MLPLMIEQLILTTAYLTVKMHLRPWKTPQEWQEL